MSTLSRIQLSIMMLLQFFIWGSWYVTAPNYLGTIGFTGADFGTTYAVGPIAGIIAPFFVGVNALVAGLLLILSGFTGRTLAILGIALAAALAFVGHQFGLPIPTFEVGDGQKLQPGHLTAAGGLLLGLLMLALPGRKVR